MSQALSILRSALRPEPAVRLAVLFGSTAVGEDDDRSDVDLLVVHRNPTPLILAGLKLRLRRALDRPVNVIDIERAEAMPTLLTDVLCEGHVVIDRDGLWETLYRRWGEILAAAVREERATAMSARGAVEGARERLAAMGDPR
ncbi:MAG TPA: nucleotidyltransferase domain-containing protein [Solirubrobacteraceae bacterium]|nr:nucleotidyltransferase domain-containing protein [Solirubrobacteraceae bacterium]